jgi:hypothetical protein
MTRPYDILAADAGFVFLRDQYLGEDPAKLHKHGGKKSAGDVTGAFHRILTDSYIRWMLAMDEDGNIRRIHRAPKTPGERDEHAMPAHESVKHRKPRDWPKDEPPPPGFRWLRAVIAWRFLPCLCNCEDIVAHVSMIEGTRPETVTETVLDAVARCLTFLDRAGAVPPGVPVRKTAAAWSSHRRVAETPSATELPYLARVYEPGPADAPMAQAPLCECIKDEKFKHSA